MAQKVSSADVDRNVAGINQTGINRNKPFLQNPSEAGDLLVFLSSNDSLAKSVEPVKPAIKSDLRKKREHIILFFLHFFRNFFHYHHYSLLYSEKNRLYSSKVSVDLQNL